MLLSRSPADYDVATSAPPAVVLDLFPRTFAVGAHFGVVLVADLVEGHEIVTEVATFRSDGAYSDGGARTASASHRVQRRTSSAATSPSTDCFSIRKSGAKPAT